MEEIQWANAYLQQADALRFYIKQLKRQSKRTSDLEQNLVKTRIDILYSMYLDCKHTGEFLYKRAKVKEVLKQERRERAYVKQVTEFGQLDGKHIWNAAVSISK